MNKTSSRYLSAASPALVRAWGGLAFATLATAGLLAVVVLLAPEGAVLRRSLVAHASFAVLLWPVSVLGLLVTRQLAGQWSGLSVAALGFMGFVALTILGLMLSGIGKSTLVSFVPVFWLPAHPFLLVAALFTGALLLAATCLRRGGGEEHSASVGLSWLLLPFSVTLASLLWASLASAGLAGHVRAEVVVWAAGHAWQYALSMLMVWSWLRLAGVEGVRQRAWSIAASLPVFGVPVVQALYSVDQESYLRLLPELLRWTLWPIPVALAVWLLRDGVYRAVGGAFLWTSVASFGLSQVFVAASLSRPDGGRFWLDAVEHGGGIALALGLLGVIVRLPEFSGSGSSVAAGRKRAWAICGIGALLAAMLFALVPRDVTFQSLRDRSLVGSAAMRKHIESRKAEEIRTRFAQGVRMLQMREYDFAIQAFHRVLELDPQLPEAHANMGFALYEKGDFAGAQRFFESATALNKSQVNAYYGLALAAYGQKNYGVAVGAMRAWLHLAPPDDPFRSKAEAKFDEMRKAWVEERGRAGSTRLPEPPTVTGGKR